MKPFAIAAPCHEDWNRMRRDGSARHCASCDKHVVDLAQLTPAQVNGLVTLTGGRFCGRQTVRGDEIVLMPAPMKRPSPFSLRMVVGGAVVASALGAAACQPAAAAGPTPVETSAPIVLAQVDPDPRHTAEPTPAPADIPVERYEMGEIAAPPRPEDATIGFGPKSAKLSKAYLPALGDVAAMMKGATWSVVVEGHADESEGDVKKTDALALARANAVKAALVKLGVPSHRLVAVSRGASSPAWLEATPEDQRTMDPRVSFRILR